jgi:hypothetical protein
MEYPSPCLLVKMRTWEPDGPNLLTTSSCQHLSLQYLFFFQLELEMALETPQEFSYVTTHIPHITLLPPTSFIPHQSVMSVTRSKAQRTKPLPMPAVHSPGLKQRGKKSNSEEQKMDIIKSSIPLPVQLPMAVATVLPGPPPPKKRGRPPKAAASDEESNPMAKRSKSNGAKGGRKPATSAQAKIPAPTRDALPACTVRNDCPATKANLLPAPRCSTKQVAVDHEALRQAAEEEVERGIAATKFLAQMQVDEEELDAAMEANIPQQISAVTGMRPVEGIEDDEAESFESVSSCSEDYHNNEVKVVPAKPVVSVLLPPIQLYHSPYHRQRPRDQPRKELYIQRLMQQLRGYIVSRLRKEMCLLIIGCSECGCQRHVIPR